MSRSFPRLANISGARALGVGNRKRDLPKIGENPEKLQVIYGDREVVAFCMMKLKQEDLDWEVVVRLVGSAVMSIINDGTNILGSKGVVKEINTLVTTNPDGTQATLPEKFDTGFEDDGEVNVAEWNEELGAEDSELGAYWGVLMRAFINVPPEGASLDQFNKNRRGNATKALMRKPRIFVENSDYITRDILRKVEAAFYNNPAGRANMIQHIVAKIDMPKTGMAISFYQMFEMLENSGMTGYALVKEGFEKGLPILAQFPEIWSELEYIDQVLGRLNRMDQVMLPWAKLALGDEFVPGSPNEMAVTIAICKEIVSHVKPKMRDYKTSDISEEILAKARRLVRQHFEVEVLTPPQTDDVAVQNE